MKTLRKPLKRCVNGCDAPPKAPSLVLCAACFAKLDAKFEALRARLASKDGA